MGFLWWPSMMPWPLMQCCSAFMVCAGWFVGAKALNHYLDSDLITAPGKCHNSQAVQTPAREASRSFLWWPSMMPWPLMPCCSAFMVCSGWFVGAKAVNHYLDSDLSTTHGQHHDPVTVQTPAREASRGFLWWPSMMPWPLMLCCSAFMVCTGWFVGA